MISARASSAITLGARPPASVPMLSVLGPSRASSGSGMRRISARASSSLFDGGLAQFGIGGVGHLAGGADFVAERALAAERELVFGGLAVDDVARSAGRRGRLCRRRRCCAPRRPRRAARNRAAPSASRALDRFDHAGDDALGVAGAASPDEIVVLAGGEERRHGIDVGGERDDQRLAPLGEDVEAPRFDFDALDVAVVKSGEGGEVVVEVDCRPAPRCW